MNFLERVKKDSKYSLLLMLGLALLGLILLVIFIGFALWFWIMLVLWILFILTFYFRLFAFVAITSMLTWIIFVIFIALTITFMFTGGGSNSSGSSGGLVACTSTSSDAPTTISGYKATMFAQPVAYEGTADNGVRTFSIKELDAKTGNDIFFHIERSDGGYITGTKGLIEVCNEDNMTQKYSSTKDSITDGASSTAQGATYYMHGNDKITVPGTYRVDGYANVDGTWKLVGRISDITATN